MDNRKETAEKIIAALTNRSGFNDLWYNLDEEIQTEITDEIVNILPIPVVVLSDCDYGHNTLNKNENPCKLMCCVKKEDYEQ